MQNIVQTNLQQIKALMLSYGVEKAYAFGSAINGNMHAGSDVDFVIRFAPDMDYETYGNNYFKLLYALQNLLKKDVELVAEETLTNPYLIESINRQTLDVI
ncbi:nucleotidyltransferase domain-containing protein [uncultured Mucilaginibacter sp.]|uniref:nucleotidyltransferase family protein n=1 Tax=uncultured Mucilaginibacter sp. TaxID=797541 RepID=UPI0025CC41C8|nr:nucleotidyltransferase domain-containing protein [uncultured Mucilaginibacter sp.]